MCRRCTGPTITRRDGKANRSVSLCQVLSLFAAGNSDVYKKCHRQDFSFGPSGESANTARKSMNRVYNAAMFGRSVRDTGQIVGFLMGGEAHGNLNNNP
jgi:hypothetical protein